MALKDKIVDILTELQRETKDEVRELVGYDVKDEWLPKNTEDLRALIQKTRENVQNTSRSEKSLADKIQKLDKYEAEIKPLKGCLTTWQRICCYKLSPDTIGVDCDVALRTVVLYWLAFDLGRYGWKVRLNRGPAYQLVCDDANWVLRGDTMNSYATTVHKCVGAKDSTILQNYGEYSKKLPAPAMEFMRWYHTLGNFIPAPPEFNMGHGAYDIKRLPCDYWDLTLLAIYSYYHEASSASPSFSLRWLVGSMENVKQVQAWLNSFGCWDEFVERNYLQPFVRGAEGGPYGRPRELWAGHFTGDVMPTGTTQFEQFFTRASDWIEVRGKIIAEVVQDKLKSKNDDDLADLARQMVKEA